MHAYKANILTAPYLQEVIGCTVYFLDVDKCQPEWVHLSQTKIWNGNCFPDIEFASNVHLKHGMV